MARAKPLTAAARSMSITIILRLFIIRLPLITARFLFPVMPTRLPFRQARPLPGALTLPAATASTPIHGMVQMAS